MGADARVGGARASPLAWGPGAGRQGEAGRLALAAGQAGAPRAQTAALLAWAGLRRPAWAGLATRRVVGGGARVWR